MALQAGDLPSIAAGGLPAPDLWPSAVSRLAAEWRLPIDWIAAACLVAGIPCDTANGDPPAAVLRLANDQRDWLRVYLPDALEPAAHPVDVPALRLRALYRAIYCDAPEMRHILMLLAARHLRLFSDDADPALADEMLAVYVPAAQRLGMYHVRRAWVEECLRRQHSAVYTTQADTMGIQLEATSENLEALVIAQQAVWLVPRPGPGPTLPPADGGPLTLEARGWLVAHLRHELDRALRDVFGSQLPPYIDPVFDLPGHALNRAAEAGTTEQPQLVVRLFCRTADDCYRAMAAVHRVCPPAGATQSQAIRDFIAAPQPNGYRTLQTLGLWSPPAGDLPARLIKVYILTEEMYQVNEWGILAAAASDATARAAVVAWWNQLDGPSAELERRTKGRHKDIVAYVRDHPPGGSSRPLYCFSPAGQLFLLDEKNTALDFAYRVHTQLGPHTAQIQINGDVVPFATELRNADLVQVTFDMFLARIDFAWLGMAKWRRSRAKIRGALRRRASFIHRGRCAFEETVMRWFDLYHHRRDRAPYTPPICATADVEHFLERAAIRLGMSDLDALYGEIAGNAGRADKLAHRFISELISPNFRLPDGQSLSSNLQQIILCQACRPTPNDEDIKGQLLRKDTLVVHLNDCRQIRSDANLIDLQRDPQDNAESWPLYRFEISTPDFDGLLNRVLSLVYDIPHAYLFRINAEVNQLLRATIKLDVAAKLPQLCHDLRLQIARMADDTQVSYRPEPAGRRVEVRPADMSRRILNPFTEGEVTDWRFFGRDEIINAIIDWTYGNPLRSQTLFLYGQRRVGKSSLVKRIIEHEQDGLVEFPQRRVAPVLVDFRLASLDQPFTVAELLVQRVFDALHQPIPRLELHDDPIVWLDRQLTAAERLYAPQRLLIIADEFDAGYGQFVRRRRRPIMLDKLWAIISRHPDIRWLLVVQDIYRIDPILQAALPHLPVDPPQINIRHLPRPVARQLIVDLSTRHEFHFAPPADAIPEQILDWTAGNPYLIHVLCRRLLDRVKRARRLEIRPIDLDGAVREVLGRPAYFDHLTQPLQGWRRDIVLYLAEALALGQSWPLATAKDELTDLFGLSDRELDGHITFLEQIGVLETVAAGPRRTVGFPIHLLHEALRDPDYSWGADPLGDIY